MSEALTSWVTNKAFLVRPDGQCLFLRDTGLAPGHDLTKGWWDLPGGRMNVGDLQFEEALRREIEEEIGYVVPADTVMTRVSTQVWRRKDERYLVGSFFRIDVPQDLVPITSAEHSEVVWNTVAEQIKEFMRNDDGAYVQAMKDYIRLYE